MITFPNSSPSSLVGVGDYIPNCQTLNEVVVTAKAPEINPQIGKSIQETVAASGVKPSGKDFLSLLRPKDRKRKKLGKKTMEALENY